MQVLTILATAVATQGFVVLQDWWLLGREGRFALVYAAIFLERFAD